MPADDFAVVGGGCGVAASAGVFLDDGCCLGVGGCFFVFVGDGGVSGAHDDGVCAGGLVVFFPVFDGWVGVAEDGVCEFVA